MKTKSVQVVAVINVNRNCCLRMHCTFNLKTRQRIGLSTVSAGMLTMLRRTPFPINDTQRHEQNKQQHRSRARTLSAIS